MLSLSLRELKAIARIRGINGYKSTSEDRLLSIKKAEAKTGLYKTTKKKEPKKPLYTNKG